jgi:hypothetical protein
MLIHLYDLPKDILNWKNVCLHLNRSMGDWLIHQNNYCVLAVQPSSVFLANDWEVLLCTLLQKHLYFSFKTIKIKKIALSGKWCLRAYDQCVYLSETCHWCLVFKAQHKHTHMCVTLHVCAGVCTGLCACMYNMNAHVHTCSLHGKSFFCNTSGLSGFNFFVSFKLSPMRELLNTCCRTMPNAGNICFLLIF